jgi:hypothetical protein
MPAKLSAAVLALIGALAFVIAIAADEEAAAILASAFIAAAIAILYRPDTLDLVQLRRRPTWNDLAFAALCMIAAFLLLAGAEALCKWPSSDSSDARGRLFDQVEHAQYAAWSILSLLPITARVMRHTPPGQRAPLWPMTAGMGGAALIAFGIFLGWIGIGQPLLTRPPTLAAAHAFSVISLTEMGLFLGFGGCVWLSAFKSDAAPAPSPRACFRSGLPGAVAGMVVLCGISIAGLVRETPGSNTFLIAILCLITAAAWIVLFLRLWQLAPTALWRSAIAILVLALAIPASFIFAAMLAEAREWAILLISVIAPVVGVMIVLMQTVGHLLLKLLLQGQRKRPDLG